MKASKLIKKYFKSTEEIISMFLGLVIVVVVAVVLFNYIQKRKGNITIPGLSDINITEEDFTNKEKENGVEGNYTVAKNDSLWKIAQEKYSDGFAWKQIAQVNNINQPYFLEVGQKLVLPKIEKKDSLVSIEKDSTIGVGEYKVERNDNLWKIAVRAYGDGYQWTKVWQENKSKLNSPDKLEIGMVLNIPSLK